MGTDSAAPPSARPAEKAVAWAWLLPVWALWRPAAAGRLASARSRWGAIGLLVAGLVALAAVVVGLEIYNETRDYIWVPAGEGEELIGPSTGYWNTNGRWEEVHRTPWEVWVHWRETAWLGWITMAEVTLVMTFALGVSALLGLAWLNWPLVHRGGRLWASYWRSWRVGLAWLWPVTWCMLLWGTLYVKGEITDFPQWFEDVTGGRDYWVWLHVPFVAFAVYLVVWLRLAVRGLERAGDVVEDEADERTPLCEGCGYNLTHLSEGGRCTECGLDLQESLDPERRRRGVPWARRRGALTWLETVWMVLVRPRSFYSRLRVRVPVDSDSGFAVRTYVLLGLMALLWGVLVTLAGCAVHNEEPPWQWDPDVIPAMVMVAVWWSASCWWGARGLAALMFTWWAVRKRLPGARGVGRMIMYESAFLWVFSGGWGLLVMGLVVGADMIGPVVWMWTLVEGAVFFLMIGLLVMWVWRFGVARRAIQWANF